MGRNQCSHDPDNPNIAYQGNFDANQRHSLGIPDAAFDINGVEFHGRVSFLKAGSFYASHVTTVSPTYATEITTETQGAGLHGLMESRAARGQLSESSTGSTKVGTRAAIRIYLTISIRTT
jgi:glycogen synthase